MDYLLVPATHVEDRYLRCRFSGLHGGDRDKWTRIVANFGGITVLNIKCDRSHTHLPWGFAKDQLGQQVWATSLESQYLRKMCIALVNTVLQFASKQGLKLRANSFLEDNNPLLTMQRAQIGAQQQPKPSKILPVVPDSVDLALIPSALMAKLPHDIQLYTKSGLLEVIPKFSRYLCFSRLSAHQQGGDSKGQDNELLVCGDFSFEVAFGLPWNFLLSFQERVKLDIQPWPLRECLLNWKLQLRPMRTGRRSNWQGTELSGAESG